MWLPIIICSLFMQPFAQEEEVIVTGSRIDKKTVQSSSIQTVQSSSIQHEYAADGIESLGSLLRGLGTQSSGSSPNSYSSYPNLRGLGMQRTLVLINGRRTVTPFPSTTGQLNIDTTPSPVIDRIKILQDGASAVYGADAIAGVINYNIQQIEVIRGPRSVLYGNGAMGGIINIVDNTIARKDFDEQSLNISLGTHTGSSGQDGSFSYTNNLGGLNLTFSYNNTDFGNYDVPSGAIEDADEASGGDDDIGQETTLQDSDFQSEQIRFGISKVGDWGYVGASYENYESVYGIPFQGGDVEQGISREYGDVKTDSFRFEWSFKPRFESIDNINFTFRDSDITNTEHETFTGNTDDTSTDFSDKRKEGRVSVDFSTGRYSQKATLDYTDSTQSLIGDETFMSPVDNEEMTLGYFVSRKFNDFNVDFGIRRDQSDLSPEETDNRDFNTTSLALGIGGDLSHGISARFGISSFERAPSAIELFMNGPHLDRQRFEIGDPDLTAESSRNWDLTFDYKTEATYASATFYRNDVDDYIYLQDETVHDPGSLTLANYKQQDATFEGYKLELGRTFNVAGSDLGVTFGRETVTGEFADGTNVPRTAPAINTLRLAYTQEEYRINATLSDVAAQKEVATNETPTDGFKMLDVSASKDFKLSWGSDLKVSLFGNNLLDGVARNHTWFVKDEVPLPGRNYGVILRIDF